MVIVVECFSLTIKRYSFLFTAFFVGFRSNFNTLKMTRTRTIIVFLRGYDAPYSAMHSRSFAVHQISSLLWAVGPVTQADISSFPVPSPVPPYADTQTNSSCKVHCFPCQARRRLFSLDFLEGACILISKTAVCRHRRRLNCRDHMSLERRDHYVECLDWLLDHEWKK